MLVNTRISISKMYSGPALLRREDYCQNWTIVVTSMTGDRGALRGNVSKRNDVQPKSS